MSNYKYILDAGHGGVIDGVYQTSGKRSPEFPDGRVLYEGVFNRAVVKKVNRKLKAIGIDKVKLIKTNEDVPLRTRTNEANAIHAKDRRTILISVHANAYGTNWNSANGIDTFYFKKGERFSGNGKKLAEIFQKHLINETGRRDRGIKGRNFHMLRETAMPSVLLECGFMTNLEEAELLMSDEYQDKVANAIIKGIKEIENTKPV